MSPAETQEFWIGILGGSVALAFTTLGSVFYMRGGRHNNWIRRYLSSLVVAIGTNVIAICFSVWAWYYIMVWPFLIFGFSLGYGDTVMIKRVLKRLTCVAGCLLASIWMAWWIGTTHAWEVMYIQALVGLGSVILGVRNPFPAAVEEVFVFATLTLFTCAFPLTVL